MGLCNMDMGKMNKIAVVYGIPWKFLIFFNGLSWDVIGCMRFTIKFGSQQTISIHVKGVGIK